MVLTWCFNSHPASGAEDGLVRHSGQRICLFQFASRLRGGRWQQLAQLRSMLTVSIRIPPQGRKMEDGIDLLHRLTPVSIRIPPQGRKMGSSNIGQYPITSFNSHPASGAEDGLFVVTDA